MASVALEGEPPPTVALAASIFLIKRSRFGDADARSSNKFFGISFSNCASCGRLRLISGQLAGNHVRSCEYTKIVTLRCCRYVRQITVLLVRKNRANELSDQSHPLVIRKHAGLSLLFPIG